MTTSRATNPASRTKRQATSARPPTSSRRPSESPPTRNKPKEPSNGFVRNSLRPHADRTHASRLVIRECLMQLCLRVHYERAVARHRLINRLSGDQQELGLHIRSEL